MKVLRFYLVFKTFIMPTRPTAHLPLLLEPPTQLQCPIGLRPLSLSLSSDHRCLLGSCWRRCGCRGRIENGERRRWRDLDLQQIIHLIIAEPHILLIRSASQMYGIWLLFQIQMNEGFGILCPRDLLFKIPLSSHHCTYWPTRDS